MVIHIITRYGLSMLITCNVEGFLTFSVGYERIQHTEEMRKKFQAGQPISLQDAIPRCKLLGATDKRDKIFALIGLSSDAGDSEFDPDYKRDGDHMCTG